METQKTVNLLMIQTMKIQNLQQKNGMLLVVNQKVIIHTKIQSNF